MLCVFPLPYGVVSRNCRALLLQWAFPALLLSRVYCLWVGIRREGSMLGELGSPTTNERPHHVSRGDKVKKVRVYEAGGVLIIIDNCFKLILVGVLENAKI